LRIRALGQSGNATNLLFLGPSRHLPGWYFNYDLACLYQILLISLFKNHHLLVYKVSDADSVTKHTINEKIKKYIISIWL